MEPLEFVERQVDLNKDVLKVLKLVRSQTEIQNEINRNIATHVDAQANRIKQLEQLVYAMALVSSVIVIAIAVILATRS